MGLAAGTVAVYRGGCMGLEYRNRLLPLGPSRFGDVIEHAVAGVQLADAGSEPQQPEQGAGVDHRPDRR
jgi:hypothetical protein